MGGQINPFVYGRPVPPTHFIGRKDAIRKCYNQLAGPMCGSIAINGEHGVGKTSLLHYVGYTARAEGWGRPHTRYIFVYLYCPSLDRFTATRFCRRVLEEVKDEADPALHREIDKFLGQDEIQVTDFGRFLRRLGEQGITLALMSDGFDWIIKTDTASQTEIGDFLSHLRALTNDPDCSLPMLTASRERLNVLCHDIVKDRPESEFYNGFIFQPLSPFSDAEVNTLLEQAMKTADFELTQPDRALLQRLAGAHPALLQMAGYLLFEKRRDAPLSDQTCMDIVEEFEREAQNYFSHFWQGSSLLEQTLLVLSLLLHLPEPSALQVGITRAEMRAIAERYKRVLAQLAERGLIQQADRSPRIFSPLFAWWIVREIATGAETASTSYSQNIGEESLQQIWTAIEKLAPQLSLDKQIQALVLPQRRPDADSLPIPVRFEVVEEIARGASGVVCKAIDTHLGRPVAIKVLRSELISDANQHRQLLREARTASHFQHPNIVTIYDVLEHHGQIVLIMEYVEGKPLSERIAEGPLPPSQVAAVIEQAAAALEYAHRRGVIHRDIKPANLMITSDGVLKLADFGIAKAAGLSQTADGGEFQGTVMYMSPEQLASEPGKRRLDHRCDLFSLAVVAFEMLCGDLPWSGRNPLELMSEIEEGTPRSIAEFNVAAKDKLEPIFQRALAKNPDERYQRGKDFAQALKDAASHIQVYGTGNRWALLVGIDHYDDKLNYPQLDVCMNDIKATRDQLIAGGVDPDRIHLLTEDATGRPTRARILTALQTIANAADEKDLLFFYFSGHGDEHGGESYLITCDSHKSVLADTAVPITRVKEIMEQASAQAKVIVLDACHVGARLGKKGVPAMSTEFLRRVFEEAEGLAILSSCKQEEFSYPWPERELSVFTHFLLEALEGQADRDRKGFVTVQDVHRHVTNGVKLWASKNNVSQTPTLKYEVAGDIMLASYS